MIIIYTDGSTRSNGKADAEGGFGVVVFQGPNENNLRVVDAYAEYHQGTTNNRMELSAILWALEHYGSSLDDFTSPLVLSDSKYCVNSLNIWIDSWSNNNWTRTGNKPVLNKDLMEKYKELTKNKKIELWYVRGHQGILGNELADKLATGVMTAEEVLKRYGGNNE